MNRLSKETVLKGNGNPKETDMIVSTLDIEGLQSYIEMIDQQKKRIKKKQRSLLIFNTIVVTLFVIACICSVFRSFDVKEDIYAFILYIAPLHLTCLVFIVALCKI